MDLALPPVSGLVSGTQAAEPSSRARATEGAPAFAASLSSQAGSWTQAPAEVAPEAFRRFEAMVLSQFVEAMLPKDADAAYGGGLAGDMWRGLAAEKIADEVAERGGVGIARHLLRDPSAAQAETAQGATDAGGR
ncbi:MAG TPA: rod-binding protein [Mesorhizobium sp.]|jgi:Rod binding domain-containing protein|nr:rod-binding protein [Mesorhizobium sp.]